MLKIIISGYGRMGKLVEKLALSNDVEVLDIVDPNCLRCKSSILETNYRAADVCIDFTIPSQAKNNIETCARNKLSIVIGTTGWFDQLHSVKSLVIENNIGLVYASNFSFGINLFYKIVRTSAKLVNRAIQYDPFGYELHHNGKIDSPSGTAKELSRIILEEIDRKTSCQFDKLNERIKNNEFHFSSTRAGNIPGTHVVGFDSFADTIELKHTARNREGFALGAIKAAKWVIDKKGMFDFGEIFEEILTNE